MLTFQTKTTEAKTVRYLTISGVRFTVDTLGRVKVVKSTIPNDMFDTYQARKEWVDAQYIYIKGLMLN